MLDTVEILAYLGCHAGPPGMRHLNRLVRAYVRRVPWESVTRIVRRAETPDPAQCPRWPEEFWRAAIDHGSGGTCFESSYAFFELLQQLGYTGYLTVNDIGDQPGGHAAIVLDLDGRKVLADIAIPLLAALRLDPGRATHRTTWLHHYTVRPVGVNRYHILRSRHPKRLIYTLLDTPVAETDYRQVVGGDYGEGGLFLDRVIIVKVIGERLWRFSSADRPWRMEGFGAHDRQEVALPPGEAAALLAERFEMEEGSIAEALRLRG